MSTCVHEQELYPDIYPKEKLGEMVISQASSVQHQINKGCDIIEIFLPGLVVHIDYTENTISVIG